MEEVDCTMDCNAYIDRCEIFGEIRVNCKLSAMPHLQIEFNHPEIFADVSFHPCVLLHPYNKHKIIKFIPPDGKFVLMNYRIKGQLHPPIHVRPKYDQSEAKISVELKGDRVENTILTIPWDSDMALSAVSVNKGSTQINDVEQACKWNLGIIDKPEAEKNMTPTKYTFSASIPRDSSPTLLFNNPIRADFTMKSALSGLKVDSLIVSGFTTNSKPFKGLRTMSRAGNYYIHPNSLTSGVTTKHKV